MELFKLPILTWNFFITRYQLLKKYNYINAKFKIWAYSFRKFLSEMIYDYYFYFYFYLFIYIFIIIILCLLWIVNIYYGSWPQFSYGSSHRIPRGFFFLFLTDPTEIFFFLPYNLNRLFFGKKNNGFP